LETEGAWKKLKSDSEIMAQKMAEEIQRLNGIIEKKNNEIRALGGEVQEAQENLRLSSQQATRLSAELNDYRNKYGLTTQEIDTYKQRIQKLMGENAALGDDMRSAQENLRLSAGTLNKLQGEFKQVCGELDEHKKRLGDTEGAWKKLKSESEIMAQKMAEEIQRLNGIIEKKNNEIRALGGEVQEAQENLRLSSQQATRLSSELNDYRNKYGLTTQEIDTYKQRIQKLMGENSALGEDMRNAQENLRLSAGTLSKLQGEFKQVCGELDEHKKRLGDTEGAWKKLKSESEIMAQKMA
jgi:chromosome segregation ATPase